MCGIVGYISKNSAVDKKLLKKMTGQIVHRGPDDCGFYCKNNVGLGMRRLSIIDLSTGNQPIFNEDKSRVIVFNGEIYNYNEIKPDLIKKGHKFKTKSDTEVILHEFENSGKNCMHKLNGMFAFAIYDEKLRKLFLARDRMGVKPLYYYFDGEKFVFGSEIKAILEADISRKLNNDAFWDYLTFRYVPEPHTIWQNIYKLPPAHYLSLDLNTWKMEIMRYWDIPYETANKNATKGAHKNATQALDEFTFLFEDAVKKRLAADVPVGVLLSGGLDSTAVLSAIAKNKRQGLQTFSVGYKDDDEFSELKYAKKASKFFGVENHEILIDAKDFIKFLPEMVWHTDEPLADLASVPLYYVSKLAKKHVTVVLSGEGADEILAGYDFDRLLSRKGLIANLRKSLVEVVPPHMTNYFSQAEKQQMVNARFKLNRDSINTIRNYYRTVKDASYLNKILYAYCQSWLVEDLLMKADKMTMAASVELRVPFLDYRLVEWAAKLDDSFKVGELGGKMVTKKILRMYARGKVPESVLNREKRGFPVPAYKWLSGDLKNFAYDTLNSSEYIKRVFKPASINAMLTIGTSATAVERNKHELWLLLVLSLWFEKWQPEL